MFQCLWVIAVKSSVSPVTRPMGQGKLVLLLVWMNRYLYPLTGQWTLGTHIPFHAPPVYLLWEPRWSGVSFHKSAAAWSCLDKYMGLALLGIQNRKLNRVTHFHFLTSTPSPHPPVPSNNNPSYSSNPTFIVSVPCTSQCPAPWPHRELPKVRDCIIILAYRDFLKKESVTWSTT